MSYILVIWVICLVCFAIWKEVKESKDSWRCTLPRKKNKSTTLLKKINICSGSYKFVVRWRRAMLFTIIAIILLSLFILKRIPSSKEFILSFCILFGLTYMLIWFNDTRYYKPVEESIKESTALLKKRIKLKDKAKG